MACDPILTAREVLDEWINLTFGDNPDLKEPLLEMMLSSRYVYEKYTTPLALGWMVNTHHHYGPSPDGYEFSKWGTYHRASHKEIGIDRTDKGTGYTSQYHPFLSAQFNDVKTCPEELLLFFHRLPYDFRLKCGRTLIQYIYDTHFEGVEAVKGFINTWNSLQSLLPPCAYQSVSDRLTQQLLNSREWRDVINTYFHRLTSTPDKHNRAIYK
jgi:alpha-glucuronidase